MNQKLPGTEDVTTDGIVNALLAAYDGDTFNGTPEHVAIREARVGTGAARRSIDVFAIHQYASKGHERIAFEVKVSRTDWRRELKDPTKRRDALLYSNYFYFVTPPGLVTVEELPPECGLMEYRPQHAANSAPAHEWRKLRRNFDVVVSAPYRDSGPPTWDLFVSLLRAERARCIEQGARRGRQIDERIINAAYGITSEIDRVIFRVRKHNPELMDDDLIQSLWNHVSEYRWLTGASSGHLLSSQVEPFADD